MYKVMHGIVKVDEEFFPLSPIIGARGDPIKLIGSQFKTDLRKSFFTQCIMNMVSAASRCWDGH